MDRNLMVYYLVCISLIFISLFVYINRFGRII